MRVPLPIALQNAIREVRSPLRDERRAVRATLTPPATIVPSSRKPGSVWAVTMVRNEQDTIEHVVRHLFRQGVDAVIVADNLSTDATPAILRELARELPVHIAHDGLDAYYQRTKMTTLSRLAMRAGADWVVPFDADELWFAEQGSLADALRRAETPIVQAIMHHVFPSASDDPNDPNPFTRLRHIDPVVLVGDTWWARNYKFGKVAFKPNRTAQLSMGNHRVLRSGRMARGLRIAHFPWRTREQLRRKVEQGSVAIAAAGLAGHLSRHWTEAAEWGHDRTEAVWRDLEQGRPVPSLMWSPSGAPLVEADIASWETWQLPPVDPTR